MVVMDYGVQCWRIVVVCYIYAVRWWIWGSSPCCIWTVVLGYAIYWCTVVVRYAVADGLVVVCCAVCGWTVVVHYAVYWWMWLLAIWYADGLSGCSLCCMWLDCGCVQWFMMMFMYCGCLCANTVLHSVGLWLWATVCAVCWWTVFVCYMLMNVGYAVRWWTVFVYYDWLLCTVWLCALYADVQYFVCVQCDWWWWRTVVVCHTVCR